MTKNRLYHIALPLVGLFIIAASCGKVDPTPTPAPKPTPTPSPSPDPGLVTRKSNELNSLTETTINGTAISSTSDIAGLAFEPMSGKPIAGLPVTDGYSYTVTDANGVYQMTRNPLARKVYYCTPAEYEINLDSRHIPYFYSSGTMESGKKYRVDFALTPLDAPETEVNFIMIGDPQCSNASQATRYASETMVDIRNLVNNGSYKNVYAVTLGDIIHDSSDVWPNMVQSMSNVKVGDRYIPFFQCMGNHDHDARLFTDGDTNEMKRYKAAKNFVDNFGPNDYSFDRGNVHVVILDDVMVNGAKDSSKSNKRTCSYGTGLFELQYKWLQQDIAQVKNKADKIIFICMHIPIRGTTSNHMADIMTLCKQFKDAHIMIGHTHYSQNYPHASYKCAGGQSIYEHIHGSACGSWWSGKLNCGGQPNGYNVYTVKNGRMEDWVTKATGKDLTYQMRVYDGNQTYTGTKGYVFNWYNASNKVGSYSFVVKGYPSTKGCFVAEVFDDDSDNTTVEFWQEGKKVGTFTRIPNASCANVAASSYYYNELKKTSDSYCSNTASHYWFYRPSSTSPSSTRSWEVRAIRKIPTSGISHTFTSNHLVIDYSEYK